MLDCDDRKFIKRMGCCYLLVIFVAVVSAVLIVHEHNENKSIMSCSFEHTENCK